MKKQGKKLDYAMIATNQNYIPRKRYRKIVAFHYVCSLLPSLPCSFLPLLSFNSSLLNSHSGQTPCLSPNLEK